MQLRMGLQGAAIWTLSSRLSSRFSKRMTEREEFEQAMAALDGQRTLLGDAAVDAALDGLQQKLSALDKGQQASPAQAGERRVVAMLFCDVMGSTSMVGRFDPEEWAAIMKRATGYLIGPVTRHDGTVTRLMGDAILAFFGAPTTHEDGPRRAVRAGLEIIEGITRAPSHRETRSWAWPGRAWAPFAGSRTREKLFSEIGAELTLARTKKLLGTGSPPG
jgi:class 3 adenylate cyclase